MEDRTGPIRRVMTEKINADQRSREELEKEYGQVWDTKELQQDFEVLSFLAPFVMVVRKSDKKKGVMMFRHLPRFYFAFEPEDAK